MPWIFLIPLFMFFLVSCSSKSSLETQPFFDFSLGQGFSCSLLNQTSKKAFRKNSIPPYLTRQNKAIYGSDDRLDWFESPGITKDYWARSTVAIFKISDRNLLRNQSDGGYLVQGTTYGQRYNLCPFETVDGQARLQKFFNQPTASLCSGFLVAPDLVITAGHCIEKSSCSDRLFVFDYAKTSKDQEIYNLSEDTVYACSEVLEQKETKFEDYALVRLNRRVTDRTPLNIRRQGQPQVGDRLMMISHPSGLPSKISEGGFLSSVGNLYTAGVDAFTGSSGGVILNFATGDVEGILLGGAQDLVEDSELGCKREVKCTGSTCGGETIFPIVRLAQWIPDPQGSYAKGGRYVPKIQRCEAPTE